MTAAVLVFEELGRALVPGPLVGSHLAAGLVDGAVDGSRVVGVLDTRETPVLVEHLAGLDVLLLVDHDGLRTVDPGAIEAEEWDPSVKSLVPFPQILRTMDEQLRPLLDAAENAVDRNISAW